MGVRGIAPEIFITTPSRLVEMPLWLATLYDIWFFEFFVDFLLELLNPEKNHTTWATFLLT